MKYPFRVSRLNIRKTKVQYVILHHTWCQYPIPELKMDNAQYQMPKLYKQVMEQKIADVNYHYVLEQVKDDFITNVCRPFVSLCDYPDIHPNINRKGLHVALLGNYDVDLPDKRAYEVLAYRLLSPFMKMFSLSPSRIYLHSEISDEEESCPGEFFSKEVIISFIKRYLMK